MSNVGCSHAGPDPGVMSNPWSQTSTSLVPVIDHRTALFLRSVLAWPVHVVCNETLCTVKAPPPRTYIVAHTPRPLHTKPTYRTSAQIVFMVNDSAILEYIYVNSTSFPPRKRHLSRPDPCEINLWFVNNPRIKPIEVSIQYSPSMCPTSTLYISHNTQNELT